MTAAAVMPDAPRIGTGLPGPGRDLDPNLLVDDHQGWETFDKLLGIQCTLREIASFYDRSEQWVRDRVRDAKGMSFQEYAAMRKPKGLVSLRRKQFELALAGDRTMLIWLGKQYLGQADKMDQRVSGPDGKPLELTTSDPAKIVLEGLAQIAARQQIARETQAQVGEAHPLRVIAGVSTEEAVSPAPSGGDDE